MKEMKKKNAKKKQNIMPPITKMNTNVKYTPRQIVQWNDMYKQLLSYKLKYGNCFVPTKYEQDKKKLGRWVDKQRECHKNNKLSDYRIYKLKSVGFVFTRSRQQQEQDKSWNDMYKRLVTYKENHGDCLVPEVYKKDTRLATWVYWQRENNNSNKLSKERIDKLNSVGFVFSQQQEKDISWNDMYKRLVSYKKNHGNCLVPQAYKKDTKLGNWVHLQRQNNKKNKLSKERIDKLNSVGFVFNQQREQDMSWNGMYKRLVSYKENHGNCLVPQAYKKDTKLGNWVYLQRQNNNKNKLSKERIDKLNSIGSVLSFNKEEDNNARWNEMFQRLVLYKEKHGNCKVPRSYKEDKQLANWVALQRMNYKNNKLSDKRLSKLKEIGFVYTIYQMIQWDNMFDRLVAFKEKHGDCLVPQNYEEDTKLATWVMTQKAFYKHNKLSADRIEKLNSTGFVFTVNKKQNNKARWNEMFQRLLLYKEKYGNCKVSACYKEDKRLANWVKYQRSENKNEKLSDERLSKLKGIGFVFSDKSDNKKARAAEM